MASNKTYYNRGGNRFTGMFDTGEQFVPVDWSKITGDIVDELQTIQSEKQKNETTSKQKRMSYLQILEITKQEETIRLTDMY